MFSLEDFVKNKTTVWLNLFLKPSWCFPKKPLPENLGYLGMVCSVSLEKKKLRKLVKGRKKEEVTGLKNGPQQMNSIWKSCSYKIQNKSKKCLIQDLKDTAYLVLHSSSIHCILVRNGFSGGVAAKKPFLRKRNRDKRLRFAKN